MEYTNDSYPKVLCIEHYGGVVTDFRVKRYHDDVDLHYLNERASRCLKQGNAPESDLLVLYEINPGDLPSIDNPNFQQLIRNNLFEMRERLPYDTLAETPLRLAAFCKAEDYEPTPANLTALAESHRYPEFCRKYRCGLGVLNEGRINCPQPEKRLDDWSFVFGVPENHIFNETQQKDILALGCIISTGLDEKFFHERYFSSYPEIGLLLNNSSLFKYDESSTTIEELQQNAMRIIERKYPEIAPLMRELSGLPPDGRYEEIYALVDGSDNVVNARTSMDYPDGFRNYCTWNCSSEQIQRLSAKDECRFVRYRFDDPALLPTGGTKDQELWDNVRVTAEKYRIKPVSNINFNDAVYCFRNGRNPLHPENRKEKLDTEKAYRDFCMELKKKYGAEENKRPERKCKHTDYKKPLNRNPAIKKGKGGMKIK